MVQRFVHDCDVCGLREITPIMVGALTATEPHPVRSQLDLCRPCAEAVLKEFVEEKSLAERDAWFRRQAGRFHRKESPK